MAPRTLAEALAFAAAASPVDWARADDAPAIAAATLDGSHPPIVIMSMPRSGSSWVAETLATADQVRYLREPITQGMKLIRTGESVVAVDSNTSADGHGAFADLAFAGVPRFPRHVVWIADQWHPEPGSDRLLIKEVNPRAAAWLSRTYAPRIVTLIRHPAAVASSYVVLGWRRGDEEALERFGDEFGAAYRELRQAADGPVIVYEDLCRDPHGEFRKLFGSLSLEFSDATARHLDAHTMRSEDPHPYGTSRLSEAMVDVWSGRLTGAQVAAVRRGYLRHQLDWYADDDDWM